jgi:hypothetical protein
MPPTGLLFVLALAVAGLVAGVAARMGAEIASKSKEQATLTTDGTTKDPKRQETLPDASPPARVVLPSPPSKNSN